MKNSKQELQSLIPKNIGQYLYKHQAGILEKLFPEKSMKEIRRMIMLV